MTDYTNVSARALLVSLSISTWSARKFDRKTSAEVTDNHAADKDSGRWNKHLMAGATAHADVMKRATAARLRHYAETLPWADEGWRLLPTANYLTYAEKMRAERSAFDTALSTFLDEYPTLRESARQKLGTLYREEDFPSEQNVRSKFGWAIEFSPVPSGGDLRLELPEDVLSGLEASVESRVETATKAAMVEAWARLKEAVGRIQKASEPDGVVRSNVIEHAQDTIDALGRLNVSQDAELDAMCRRVSVELIGLAPEDLRNDERLRADTARRANEILSAMQGLYGEPEAV